MINFSSIYNQNNLEPQNTDILKESIVGGNNGINHLLIQQIQKGLNYIYRGPFTAKINENILSLFESCIDGHDSLREVKRKVYQVMVEGLQNATMHQAKSGDKKLNQSHGIFILKKEIFSYYIITGNLVTNNEKNDLVEKIRQVNFLGHDKIETQHKRILFESASSSGETALGLIEMARKSGNKFLYSFRKIDEGYSYFYLLTEISEKYKDKKIEESSDSSHFDYLPALHESLNNENILIVFNTLLNQESIVNLISFVEKELDEDMIIKKRVYSIMIEMIQNVIKHSSPNQYKNTSNSSIFYISQTEDSYFLSSGNYIENSRISMLSKRIDMINQMNNNELNNFYNEKLFDYEKDNRLGTGLGICDIKIKSKNNLDFHFSYIDKEYSFFTLKVKILKS